MFSSYSGFKGFSEIDFFVNLDNQEVHFYWKRLHILQLYGYFIAQKIKGAKTEEGGGMGGGGVGAGEYCSRGGQARRVCMCKSSQREVVVVRENCCGQYFILSAFMKLGEGGKREVGVGEGQAGGRTGK
jgi:hypothetical protein